MNAPDDTLLEQAIDWRVCLLSGHATPEQQAACLAWRQTSAAHEAAWQRLERFSERLGSLPPALLQPTLQKARHDPQRRRALRQLSVCGLLLGGTVLGLGQAPWPTWLANQRTAIGERRQWRLADGSLLHLNSNSAVDLLELGDQRRLQVHQGEVLIEAASPWLIACAQGRCLLQEGQLQLRLDPQPVRLSLYRGQASWQGEGALTDLAAGHDYWVRDTQAQLAGPADIDRTRWQQGLLVAKQMPLAELLGALRRQRHGLLRWAPQVAALRISGVFPLDDTERVLQAVARTLPVRLHYRTRYWVSVEPA